MAFSKSNVNFQFQQPNVPGLVRQAPDISGGLETLFNQYMSMQQAKRADAMAPGQLLAQQQQTQLGAQQLAQGQRQAGMADLQETQQFGAPLASYSPAQIQQAGQGFQPQGPGLPADQMRLQKLADGLHAIGEKSRMATQGTQADIDLKRSQTKENIAQADAYDRGQVYVDPDTGKQIVVPHGAKLIPRPPKGGKAATNQDLTSAMELYETAKEGLLSGLGGSETGQIMGRLPAFTAKQQIAKGSVAAMAPVLKQIFRTAGEGVFTDRDQQLLLDMIPTRTELPEARRAMIANIDAIVKAKIKSGMRNAQPAPDGASKPKSDPLGLF